MNSKMSRYNVVKNTNDAVNDQQKKMLLKNIIESFYLNSEKY